MRTAQLSKTLVAASSNNVSLSQTPGAGGNLVLNGAAVVSGVAVLDTQRVVGITGAANDSARTFTVVGTDDNGNTISETLAGPNISTVSTVNNYKTVTRVSIDAAAAGALTVGTTGVGASKPIVPDRYIAPFSPAIEVQVAGTLNYDVQYTYGDLFDASALSSLVWYSITALAGQTTNKDGALANPVTGIRLKINSGAGSGVLKVIQPGIGGL